MVGRISAWLIAALACLGTLPSSSARSVPSEDRRLAVAALTSSAATEDERFNAAVLLIASPDDRAGQLALETALRSDRPSGARRAVCRAIAAAKSEPDSLLPPLIAGLNDALRSDEQAAVDALSALSIFTIPEAFEAALVAYEQFAPSAGPAVKDALVGALASLTGRDQFLDSPDAARAWWESGSRWFSRERWRSELIRNARSAERGLADRAARSLKLTHDLVRRLHASTAEEHRPELIVSLLEATEPELRDAAFELVMVGLLNAKPLSERVAAAALSKLSDPEPAIRAHAARFAELVELPGALEKVAGALASESSPAAAAAMLRALSKRPEPALAETAVRWIDRREPARIAAWEALLACAQSGAAAPKILFDALDAPETRKIESLPRAGLSLAVRLGREAAVADLLAHPDPQRRSAAAAALAETPAGVHAILDSARDRSDLFELAVDAVRRSRPTADLYAEVLALNAPSAEARLTASTVIAQALPPSELLRAWRAERDADRRLRILQDAVGPSFFARVDELPERIEAGLALGRSLLERGEPESALALLDQWPEGWRGPRTTALRVACLVYLARFDDADALLPPPTIPNAKGPPVENDPLAADAWLDAIRAASQRPDIDNIRLAFLQRYGHTLTDAQRIALENGRK